MFLPYTYNELQTVVDKGRDRGAAFLGRDARALHAGSGCLLQRGNPVLCCRQKQTTRASMQSPRVSAQERCSAIPPLVCGRLEFTAVIIVSFHCSFSNS
ncbi:hypothetical protein Y032_0018g3541 [Ancylostoma ceylanicum]|uniref:Uncharacterized protein n=1 Tax=Ancylostoma ceylanicum TaxID=53326 RepID=A0A016V2V7_9BILA|nr:hypothetical protein Y032_0018g3541 [Ancylostoma ceylanicum]